ncbi:MAG: hypothetical protein JWP01_3947, partial [Myxococcales bacterium]|nr:hypothetical protein [Myxococcales bacterium]
MDRGDEQSKHDTMHTYDHPGA